MIINIFKEQDNNEISINKDKIEKQNKEVDILDIQKFIISNYIEYLQKDLKEEIREKIYEYLIEKYMIKNQHKQNFIADIVINKMFGYDILQKYIDESGITDIRAVSYDNIYIKKNGKWIKVEDKFQSNEEFEQYIRFCIQKNNSNINFDIPIVIVSDKKYNLRIEAGISPVNALSSSIVIRIHRNDKTINLESLFLIERMLDSKSYKIIYEAINKFENIIISGKGGSGKTTLLKAIIDKIPDNNSIITNEETAELFIKNKNIIQREIVENRRDTSKITLQKLMKHSLVMSNDVIVVGELKGEETSSFLDSICTGHMGLATVHSDSSQNTINRLITLFKRDEKNQKYTEEFIEQILASSIDYIIYLENYKVKEIAKVEYINNENKIRIIKMY